MYDGKNPVRLYIEPDYCNFTQEMLEAAFPRVVLVTAGKPIIVGTGGELDKYDLSKFDEIWYQSLLTKEEVKERYG